MTATVTRQVSMDLGTGDVHAPGAIGKRPKMAKPVKKMAPAKPGAKASPPKLGRKDQRSSRGLRVTVDHPKHGRIDVRHMADADGVLCRFSGTDIAALDDAEPGRPVWQQIAKSGHFEGHGSGPFDLNEKIFADIVRNYREIDGGHVAFDFEHASEQPATEGSIPTEGAPAQGWIRDLKIANGNLYALVEWLEPARTYITQKKYKFVSPAIRFNAKHPVTGKPIGARLTSCACTNSPFLRQMVPLAASDRLIAARDRSAADVETNGPGDVLILTPVEETTRMASRFAYSAHEYMPKLRAVLRLGELATAQECSDQLGRLRGFCEMADYDVDGMVDGVRVGDFMRPMRELVGGGMGATVDQILDVVDEMIGAAMDRHVAEDHAGLEDEGADDMRAEDADPAEMADRDQQDAGASDGDTMDPITLKDLADKTAAVATLTAEKATLAAQVTALTSEKASLALDLTEAKGKAEKAEAELVTLRDAQTKRDESDAAARVEEAFVTYKDKKSLSDDDRESMAIELKANPERFEKRYPRVDPDKRHLLRSLSENAPKTAPTVVEGSAPIATLTTKSIAKELQKKNPALSHSDAMNQAVLLRQSA